MRRRLLLHIRRTRGHTPAHQDEFAETLPTEALQTSLAGNAEIGSRFMQATIMFGSIVELMPRSGTGGGGMTSHGILVLFST